MNKTHDTQKYHATLTTDGNSENSNSEGRLRYYELTGLSEEPKKKKEIQIDDSITQIKTNEIKENESSFKEDKNELGITVMIIIVKKKIY